MSAAPSPRSAAPRSAAQLREDALAIWRAGVAGVDPEQLFAEAVRIEDSRLVIQTTRGDAVEIDLHRTGRLVIVGGGKAGAGMARGLEAALAPWGLLNRVTGLLSVPAGCVGPTQAIRLVAGRPDGVNEPRAEGAAAAAEMLALASQAAPEDVVLCLLSGGGSALLPAPLEGLTLQDKAAVARLVAAAGGTIDELNTVRQHLSRFKGGGLVRACAAGRLVTLIISDVLGDPLDLIASGPTVAPASTPGDALEVLRRLGIAGDPLLSRVVGALSRRAADAASERGGAGETLVLANNATAVDAAGCEAERRGYRHAMDCATRSEGAAEEVGRHLAQMALAMRDAAEPASPDCLITGGEPTVALAPPELRGRGGRNQQLVLAALEGLGDCRGVCLISGGTDGEDGPTDAAGGLVDAAVAAGVRAEDLADALRRNDAYPVLERAGGLLKTGPTHTNVCDLRVVVVEKRPG